MVEEGYVSFQTHPTLPLRIFKYTQQAQFERVWNEVTTRCRGLVLDGQNNVINSVIGKFHNIEELKPEEIPFDLPYEVTDKIDGSCILAFYYTGRLVVATLGSFASDQAIYAESMLKSKYAHIPFKHFRPGKTYIFELVIPQNRIVLDYGSEEKLVLITVRDNDTDEETLPDIGFPTVEKVDMTLDQLKLEKLRPDFTNKEGFVIKFSNGFRVKLKYEQYFALHKIMTGCTEHRVWEYLRENKSLTEFLSGTPDEFFNLVTSWQEGLTKKYQETLTKATEIFKTIYVPDETRKEFAMKALQHKPLSSILFKMLEIKPYETIMWDLIEPKSTETTSFNSFRKGTK